MPTVHAQPWPALTLRRDDDDAAAERREPHGAADGDEPGDAEAGECHRAEAPSGPAVERPEALAPAPVGPGEVHATAYDLGLVNLAADGRAPAGATGSPIDKRGRRPGAADGDQVVAER